VSNCSAYHCSFLRNTEHFFAIARHPLKSLFLLHASYPVLLSAYFCSEFVHYVKIVNCIFVNFVLHVFDATAGQAVLCC